MRKSSIVQITIALVIALGYVYLFGVTGRVENVPEGETTSEEITVQAEETTTAAVPETKSPIYPSRCTLRLIWTMT